MYYYIEAAMETSPPSLILAIPVPHADQRFFLKKNMMSREVQVEGDVRTIRLHDSLLWYTCFSAATSQNPFPVFSFYDHFERWKWMFAQMFVILWKQNISFCPSRSILFWCKKVSSPLPYSLHKTFESIMFTKFYTPFAISPMPFPTH